MLPNLLGGGVALLFASKSLNNLQTQNEDQKRGVQIIQSALKVCLRGADLLAFMRGLVVAQYFLIVDVGFVAVGTDIHDSLKCWF